MKTIHIVLSGLLSLSLFAAAVSAGPAPWYYYRSKLNGKMFCAQTSPGDGWTLASGPYSDSHCTKLID